jgi:transketolase
MIVARTLKGKGVKVFEGKDGWHGKPLKQGEETDRAIAELEAQYIKTSAPAPAPVIPKPARRRTEGPRPDFPARMPAPAYKVGDSVATREAYGTALAALGAIDRRVVALDSDVKNSTYSERFEKAHPDRFYQTFIAEQVMVGAAMGLASRGAIAFPSSFACFLERASDFIRMAGISHVNVKLAGSHAGVSIGEDGPSQMALEDLAIMRGVPNCTVFYPSDAVSAERIVALAAVTDGPVYIRTTRPKTPVLYTPDEEFAVGGSKTIRQSDHDAVTVVAAGITLVEALKAHDLLAKDGVAIRVIDAYCVQPIDRAGLTAAGKATGGRIITVEDHYAHGGLGDAVSEAVWDQAFRVRRLAVREIPRSGPPEVLIDKYGLSARAIAEVVRELIKK